MSAWAEVVSTVAEIADPVGVEYGVYNREKGIFVSSFSSHNIFFYSNDLLNSYSPIHSQTRPIKILTSDQLTSVDLDGYFDEASVGDPSRMLFDEDKNLLYVCARKASVIRVFNFNTENVGTLASSDDQPLTFGSHIEDTEYPGMDIQRYSSSIFIVTNSVHVYKLIRIENSLSSAIKTEYRSISRFMTDFGYADNYRIYSVSVAVSRGVIFAAVSGAKNMILSIPINSFSFDDAKDITILVGQQSDTWSGINSGLFPVSTVGHTADTKIFAPMHLQYDDTDDILIWVEGVPIMDNIMIGSLSIRQLDLELQMSSILAGADATLATPVDSKSYLGSYGGFVNGLASTAQFKYPITIEYSFSINEFSEEQSSPLVYVADRWNNAIRRIMKSVHTSEPSLTFPPTRMPTLSQRPSKYPSRLPTHNPITYLPTYVPTTSIAPSTRFRPTPMPSEPEPPAGEPTVRPTRSHAFNLQPTIIPTSSPSTIISQHIRYDDNSLFRSFGFNHSRVGGSDIALATLIGMLLAVAVVWFLILRDRSKSSKLDRKKRKKNVVLRFDDDDDDDEEFPSEEEEDDEGFGSYLWNLTVGKYFPRENEYDAFDTDSDHSQGSSINSSSDKRNVSKAPSSGRNIRSNSADNSPKPEKAVKHVEKAAETVSNLLKKLKLSTRSGGASTSTDVENPIPKIDINRPDSRRSNRDSNRLSQSDDDEDTRSNRSGECGNFRDSTGNSSGASLASLSYSGDRSSPAGGRASSGGGATIGADIQMYERVGRSRGGSSSSRADSSRGGGDSRSSRSSL